MLEDRIKELPEDRLFTVQEVAMIFGVADETIRSWINLGRLKVELKVGKGPARMSKRNIYDFWRENQGVQ